MYTTDLSSQLKWLFTYISKCLEVNWDTVLRLDDVSV